MSDRLWDDGGATLPLLLAQGIIEDLDAALEEFREIAADSAASRLH